MVDRYFIMIVPRSIYPLAGYDRYRNIGTSLWYRYVYIHCTSVDTGSTFVDTDSTSVDTDKYTSLDTDILCMYSYS
jgi:hypothetical protein